jgi:hypothetical protein
LESISKATYAEILADRLIKPLNLTRSSLHAPNSSLAVVPYNETSSYFNFALGDENPYVERECLIKKFSANSLLVLGAFSHLLTIFLPLGVRFFQMPSLILP